MHRQLALAVVACALALATQAHAETAKTSGIDPTSTTTKVDTLPVGEQEIGARLGFAAGGRVSPGGLALAGNYLYKLADRDWFDGAVGFSFGSGSAACFRDREDNRLCDHGLADGFGMYVAGGVRRFFAPKNEFAPYVRAGLAVRISSFSDDDVTGFVVPVWVGGGVRARVTDSVAIVGDALLELGGGTFNKGIGLEPHFSLAVMFGVEFKIK
jgi:hypothetical protein